MESSWGSVLPLFYWSKQFSSDPNLHPLLQQKPCMTFTWTSPIAASMLTLKPLMKWFLPVLFLEWVLVNTIFSILFHFQECFSISYKLLPFPPNPDLISDSSASTAADLPTSPAPGFSARPVPSPEICTYNCLPHITCNLGRLTGKQHQQVTCILRRLACKEACEGFKIRQTRLEWEWEDSQLWSLNSRLLVKNVNYFHF